MKTSLGDKAYSSIRSDIIACVLRPGQEVSEAKLEDRYGVGLAAVRKALSRLTQDGLVIPIPRRGYKVAPVTLQDIHEIMELRLLLEPRAARRAALASDVDPRLAKLVEGPPESNSPALERKFVQRNRDFHLTIARQSGNMLMFRVLSESMDKMERLLNLKVIEPLHGPAEGQDRMVQRAQHAALLEAIERREPDRAEQVAREHVEHTWKQLLNVVVNRSHVDVG